VCAAHTHTRVFAAGGFDVVDAAASVRSNSVEVLDGDEDGREKPLRRARRGRI